MGLAIQQPPVVVALKANAQPLSVRQYPMTLEDKLGINKHINHRLEHGFPVPCQSPWNTPFLPVEKPGTHEYRPVQDLREIIKQVEDIYTTVPNPYNLLYSLTPELQV